MRLTRRSIATVTLGSLLAAGCGGGTTENKAVEFKKTDTSQFDAMKDMMSKNVKSRSYAGNSAKK